MLSGARPVSGSRNVLIPEWPRAALDGSRVIDGAAFTVGGKEYAVVIFAFQQTLASPGYESYKMQLELRARQSHGFRQRLNLFVARPNVAGRAAAATSSALLTAKSQPFAIPTLNFHVLLLPLCAPFRAPQSPRRALTSFAQNCTPFPANFKARAHIKSNGAPRNRSP